jgi:hypothetical protein
MVILSVAINETGNCLQYRALRFVLWSPKRDQSLVHWSFQKLKNLWLIAHWNRSDQSIDQFDHFSIKTFRKLLFTFVIASFKVGIEMLCLNKTQWIAVNYFFDFFVGLSIQQRSIPRLIFKKLGFQSWDFLQLIFQWGLPSIRQILPSRLHSEEEYLLW